MCNCQDCLAGYQLYTHFTDDQRMAYSFAKHYRQTLNDQCLELIYSGKEVPNRLRDQFDISFYLLNTIIDLGRD